jgi:hypothetical protein
MTVCMYGDFSAKHSVAYVHRKNVYMCMVLANSGDTVYDCMHGDFSAKHTVKTCMCMVLANSGDMHLDSSAPFRAHSKMRPT